MTIPWRGCRGRSPLPGVRGGAPPFASRIAAGAKVAFWWDGTLFTGSVRGVLGAFGWEEVHERLGERLRHGFDGGFQ